jgi:hypothetical protein
MTVQNMVFLYGNEGQINDIKKAMLFRGEKQPVTWSKTSLNRGYTTNFVSRYEMPKYRLKEISADFPEVKINYYYYQDDGDTFILGYKKLQGGEIADELVWSNKDEKAKEREEAFAKRFFKNCLPYRYDEIFVS